jgi:hypothetical protein
VPPMRLASRANMLSVAFLLALAASSPALAQSAASSPQGTLTGKERLGEKWKDEQRIDNCKVPSEKRGAKPRPEGCSLPRQGLGGWRFQPGAIRVSFASAP